MRPLYITISWTVVILFFLGSGEKEMDFSIGAVGPYLDGKVSNSIARWKFRRPLGTGFDNTMWLNQFPGREGYLVTTRKGKVWLLDHVYGDRLTKEVLNIGHNVYLIGDVGMFDLAFHPKFDSDPEDRFPYVYIVYSYVPPELKPSNESNYTYYRLSRFTYLKEEDRIDRQSELVYIQQFDRDWLHSGGSLFFDNEGFLNLSIGDEGGFNDDFHSGQDITDRLFAGILRVDIDGDSTRSHPVRRRPIEVDIPEGWPPEIYDHYMIPNSNPWVDEDGKYLEEYAVMGLRNPHTTYYDSENDEIWVGDIGRVTREEISIFQLGGNGQWPYKEGTADGPRPKPDVVLGTETPPIHEYGRSVGNAVIGGFLYKGDKYTKLKGKYIFGDFGTKNVWNLDKTNGEVTYMGNVDNSHLGIVSMTEGIKGEILMVDFHSTQVGKGPILELIPNPDSSSHIAPERLSELGIFLDLDSLTGSNSLLSYSLTSELYSDGAVKKRWVSLPNDGLFDTLTEQVASNSSGDLQFPKGTVFIKHFELPLDFRTPDVTRKLETRFLVVTDQEDVYGVTYKWNDEGTDAWLLASGEEATYEIINESGQEELITWKFPSQQECITCHNYSSGFVLGPKLFTMNKEHAYNNQTSTSQLAHWNERNIFTEQLTDEKITSIKSTVALDAESNDLELKVRSYLQANCAFCHRPGGVEAAFDARFSTPTDATGLVGATEARQSIEEFVIAPGDPLHSEMLRRVNRVDSIRMPPLGSSRVDRLFVEILTKWIEEFKVLPIDQSPDTKQIRLTPNPSTANQIDFIGLTPNQAYEMKVFNASGSLIYETVFNYNGSISMNSVPKGLYHIILQTESKKPISLRWVKAN